MEHNQIEHLSQSIGMSYHFRYIFQGMPDSDILDNKKAFDNLKYRFNNQEFSSFFNDNSQNQFSLGFICVVVLVF